MFTLTHHSRKNAYRLPQGAVPCGTRVRISTDASDADGVACTLRLWCDGAGETLLPMTFSDGRFTCELTAPDAPCLLYYFFLLRMPDGHTLYYGGESGEGGFYTHEPPAWQITVYASAFTTPAWFRHAVVYQIFPDRFRRSSWEDFRSRAETHQRLGRTLRIHDAWNEPPLYRPMAGQKDYEPNDFFGGDLAGIGEKLPYLADMGVNCIYLNPVFESPSNHRYNTADYRNIDPILGTNGDFRHLCEAAKAHGIRILLDGVFSHTGSDSRYFDGDGRYPELGAHESADSPYRSWYRFRSDGSYECWWDFASLPNVDEMNPSYRAFIAGEDGVLAYWASMGASGWRLDVADELPDAFIRILRARVKALDADGVLLGEVWEDCSDKRSDAGRRGFVNGDELDGAMNYPLRDALLDYLLLKDGAPRFAARLMEQRERYPKPFYEACLNLISSHDVERAASILGGAPDRYQLPREGQARFALSPEAAACGRQRLLLATAVQAALPGVPCIYYGDEIGMTGLGDPFNRAPYPWGEGDGQLQGAFMRLMRARRAHPALQDGCCRMGALSEDVFVCVRYTADAAMFLFVNRGDAPASFTFDPGQLTEGPDAAVPVPVPGRMYDAITGQSLLWSEKTPLSLGARGARFYLSE